jgi:type IV secretion system protein VirB10
MTATGPSASPAEARETDIRPSVARAQGRGPLYWFVGGLAVFAVLLFSALNARRQMRSAPETRPEAVDLAGIGQPSPTLFVPPTLSPSGNLPPPPIAVAGAAVPAPFRTNEWRGRLNNGGGFTVQQAPTRIYQPPLPSTVDMQPGQAGEQPAARGGPVLVIDIGAAESGAAAGTGSPVGAGGPIGGGGAGGAGQGLSSRVRSSRVLNPSTTVPQGTTIPAVLETALDSSRPGQARAIVSLDVRGFDGTKILIPRGSRIYGEYQSDMTQGQRRALIQWTRLLRPDGVVIAIGSPSADRLGRAGIGGKVDTHFFQKFVSAVLQSSMDIGVAVASQQLGNGGLVLLPNLGQAVQPPTREIPPTLTVKQGRSIAVLVARDLDFTAGAGR